MVMIRQFCEVCRKKFGMKIVITDHYEDYIWCQCPEFGGIAPYKNLKGKDNRDSITIAQNNWSDEEGM